GRAGGSPAAAALSLVGGARPSSGASCSSGPRASGSLMSAPEARGPEDYEKTRHWSGAPPASLQSRQRAFQYPRRGRRVDTLGALRAAHVVVVDHAAGDG